MSLIRSQIEGSRRPVAVGIWSFPVILMPLTATHVSYELSFWVQFLVSVLCSAAILIVDHNRSHVDSKPGFRSHLPVAISIVIVALWAILLGERSRPFASIGSAAMGLVPIFMAAIWRSSGPELRAQIAEAKEQTSDISDPIEPVNDKTRTQSGEKSSDIESTVPFAQTQLSILDGFSEESEHYPTEFSQPDHITQWLTRSKTVDGEIIEGGVRVEFADGQRDVTVHVSFCPPLESVPVIETEDLEGDGLEIRVAAAFPFGARLTVRRSTVSKSMRTLDLSRSGRIGFVAVASNNRRVA